MIIAPGSGFHIGVRRETRPAPRMGSPAKLSGAEAGGLERAGEGQTESGGMTIPSRQTLAYSTDYSNATTSAHIHTPASAFIASPSGT
jgi:hypothetical protein